MMATEKMLAMYESLNGRMRHGHNWAKTLMEKQLVINLGGPFPCRAPAQSLLLVPNGMTGMLKPLGTQGCSNWRVIHGCNWALTLTVKDITMALAIRLY
jgi:hypothetical protein